MACSSMTCCLLVETEESCYQYGLRSTNSPSALLRKPPNRHALDITHFDTSHSIVLGAGGFSVVRAVSKIDGGVFALKIISRRKVLQRANGPQTVLRELTLLKKIMANKFSTTHQGRLITTDLLYAFTDKLHLYFVFPLCYGDLRYHLSKQPHGRFLEKTAKFFAGSLVVVLDYLHQLGLLHRDIKPENLLLTKHGFLKLTDFGISKEISTPGLVCRSTSGTHGYLAPEVYSFTHTHGPSSDYFSTGVTIHELLTGSRPFDVAALRASSRPERNSEAKYLRDLASEQYRERALANLRHNEQISSNCKDFLSSLLVFSRKKRLGAAGGVASIKSHPWFRGFDFDHVTPSPDRSPQINPPYYVPDPRDVFPKGDQPAPHLTSEDTPLPQLTDSASASAAAAAAETFKDFSFNCTLEGAYDKLRLRISRSCSYKQMPLEEMPAWQMVSHLRSSFSLHSLTCGEG